MVSLVTNHTMDKGGVGVINSVNYWRTKDNVVYYEQGLSQTERDFVEIVDGINCVFFSYTVGLMF